MKTILAATDFSASSYNACFYAAMLAKKLGCKLTLLNIYETPLIHSNSGLYFITFNNTREENSARMQTLLEDLQARFPRLKTESFLSGDSLVSEVNEFIARHQVEAVVLGLAAKTRLSKFIYGSHTTDIAGKVDAPVIVVPERFKTHTLSKAIIGVDNRHQLKGKSLQQLSRLVSRTQLKIKALHVRTRDEIFAPDKEVIKLNNKNHTVETVFGKDLCEGLNKYSRNNAGDMLVIISGSHSAIYNFFAETNTKKIAFTSSVPVMSLHE